MRCGVALGGGGAKGLAHIPMLEVLEAAGIQPCAIAGTSIGAIIGALYASGMSPGTMRQAVEELTRVPQSFRELIRASQTGKLFDWLDLIDLDIGRGSLLSIEGFLAGFEKVIGVSTFEELKIPLKVVASDFWKREEVIFDSGRLTPAIAASFALPGIFKPMVENGRVLIDGGLVNPVPYDTLRKDCDLVIAIDVIGHRKPGEALLPSYTDSLFNSFQIAQKAVLNAKFQIRRPEIYVDVAIEGVKVLEFHRAREIYEQAQSACRELEQKLAALPTDQYPGRNPPIE